MRRRAKKNFGILLLMLIILLCLYILPLYTTSNSKKPKNAAGRRKAEKPDKTSRDNVICPEVSPKLLGDYNLSSEIAAVAQVKHEAPYSFPRVRTGGYYPGPEDCEPTTNIVVIIPFRGRMPHLNVLLPHLHDMLQRQQASYLLLVVEQADRKVFNKGQLMNAGFKYSRRVWPEADCFVFHDVDMLSENDGATYRCNRSSPVHLSHRIDIFRYRFCCGLTVGGVLAMTNDQFRAVNGFSNRFYGWGAEDDDMAMRIRARGFPVHRPQPSEYRFAMLKHKRDEANQARAGNREALRSWDESGWKEEGLSSLQVSFSATELEAYTLLRVITRANGNNRRAMRRGPW